MFDRRRNSWIKNSAYIFNAIFSDGSNIEVQVNSEFSSSENAFNYAEKYSKVIGQLPNILRKDVRTVWIHKGKRKSSGATIENETGKIAKHILGVRSHLANKVHATTNETKRFEKANCYLAEV